MQTLVIGHLRLIPGFHQGLEALEYQVAGSAAQHGLFTKQIRLGFFRERGFEHTAARATNAVAVGEGLGEGIARRVLENGDQRRHAATLLVLAAHQVARALGGDQHHVDILARLDLLEMDVEAVREQQRRAFLQ